MSLQVKKSALYEEKYDFRELSFELTSDEKKEVLKLLPIPVKGISFELHNASAKLANSFRRCLIDEIPLYNMSCLLEKIQSDDRKIMVTSDCVVRHLNLIPLTQHIITPEKISRYKLSIFVKNNTMKTISVTTDDINIIEIHPRLSKHKSSTGTSRPVKSTIRKDTKTDKAKIDKAKKRGNNKVGKGGSTAPKRIDSSKYFSNKITICNLDRGFYLKIDDIIIIKKRNYDVSIGGIVHQINYVPLEYEEELGPNSKKELPMSLQTNPTKYKISYAVNGATSPIYIALSVCREILQRLQAIKTEIIKSDEIPYYSDKVDIEYEESLICYKLYKESWTIGYLLSWYSNAIEYIPYVAPKNEHVLTNTIVLRINHTNANKIVLKAIDNIVSDYTILFNNFKNTTT